MRRTRSAVCLILRQNSGFYSGAGQNTAALSEIAELRGFQQGFAGRTVKVRYSVQIKVRYSVQIKVRYSVQIRKGTVKLF